MRSLILQPKMNITRKVLIVLSLRYSLVPHESVPTPLKKVGTYDPERKCSGDVGIHVIGSQKSRRKSLASREILVF